MLVSHRNRIITGGILGPVILLILWQGGGGMFAALFAAVCAVGLIEFLGMFFPQDRTLVAGAAAIGILPPLAAMYFQDPAAVLLAFGLVLFVTACFFIISISRWDSPVDAWSKVLFAIFYMGITTVHIALLRGLPGGRELVLFLLLVIFSGDVAAYYVGCTMGKHKLCPRVSAGKTIEGAIGGLAANVVMAMVLWFFWFPGTDPRLLISIALLLGCVGQAGDLAESVVKRSVGVKDSGRILPGHGGVLDRLDAVLMAAPVFYWIVIFLLRRGVALT